MVLTNGREQIDLSSGGFRLEKMTSLPCEIRSDSSYYGALGELYRGSQIGKGRVELEGYIGSDELESKRRALFRICTAKTGFELIDGNYKLSLYAEKGVAFSSEKRFTDKLLRFKISAIAPYPLWRSTNQYRKIFANVGGVSSNTTMLSVTNSGDVPVGFKATFLIMASVGGLTLSLGDKKIYINHEFKPQDEVFIDTSAEKKSVTYIPSGSDSEIDIIGFVSPKSDFFELDVGENKLGYSMWGGIAYITIEMTEAIAR